MLHILIHVRNVVCFIFWTWKFKVWESSFDFELLLFVLVVGAFCVVAWLFWVFEFWVATVSAGLDCACCADWFVFLLVWSIVVEFWVPWLLLLSAAWASWCAPIISAEPNVIEATPNLSFLIEKKLFKMSVFSNVDVSCCEQLLCNFYWYYLSINTKILYTNIKLSEWFLIISLLYFKT